MSGVLFYIQHLFGVGHVKRAASIVRALERQNVTVNVVLGGEPFSHADFGNAHIHYLPSARAKDASFKTLLTAEGLPVDDDWRNERCQQLLKTADEVQPDILLIELFPFGRWQFRFELVPLMQAWRNRAKIVCSARDVIVGKADPERNGKIVNMLQTYFDDVLVHGVEDVIGLQETFPAAEQVSNLLTYTGYVVEEAPVSGASPVGAGEIVVSVGGGGLGEELLRAVVAAHPYSSNKDKRWRLIAGEGLDHAVYQDVERQCSEGMSLERARPDFLHLLRNCDLSVSLGGYNTVMDVMSAGCRNLVVPFTGGKETEQLFRAEIFNRRGWVNLYRGKVDDPQALANAIDAALEKMPFKGLGLDINGADQTASLIAEML